MAQKLKCPHWFDAKEIRKAVREASIEPKIKMALEVEREAKTSMEAGRRKIVTAYGFSKRGKVLTRKKTISEPSAPGEPPHVQTGIGRGSIRHAWLKESLTAIVGPSSPPAPYMGVHEFGGRDHPPRPFMRPALMRTIPRYPKLYKNLPLSKTSSGRKLAQKAKSFENKHGGKKT